MRYFYEVICTTLLIFLASCQTDDWFGQGTDTIMVSTPDMTEITSSRALTSTQENYIYSLYFFIMNGDGTIQSKKYVKLASPSSTYTGKLDNKVSSSQSVYVVANAEFTENSFDATELKYEMDNASTIAQIKNIYATYVSGDENYSRPQGHLLMSGYLVSPSTTNNTITLKHVDARVNFNIALSDAAIAKGADFEPTSYQIVNIPKKTYLIDRATDYSIPGDFVNTSVPYSTPWDAVSPTRASDYFNSDVIEYFNKSWDASKKLTSSFDFYMLENRKTALQSTGATYPTYYSLRDKKAGGNGAYIYAHQYSTYVIIKGIYQLANFELEPDLKTYTGTTQNGMLRRYAKVSYVVHLGDFGNTTNPGNTNNFFTERNCSYTYKVTVENAHSVAVEAVKNDESQPSAEGNVRDTYLAFGSLDAHFGNMLVKVDIPEDQSFYTDPQKCLLSMTPYATGTPDYSWVQFALNNPAAPTTMLTYAQAKGKLISAAKLVDYVHMISQLPAAEKASYLASDGLLYFTAFIDENYPQYGIRNADYNSFFLAGYGPTDKSVVAGMSYNGQPVTGEDHNISWTKYINQEPRELRLFKLPYTSNDGLSNYSISQVMVAQKAIQTFYDMDASPSALGIEHTDETGILACENTNKTSLTDGLANTVGDLGTSGSHAAVGKNWSTILTQTTINSNSNQLTTTYNKGNYAALQRNRDLNADGVISSDEIRWYRPAIDQLVSVSLAGQALHSPIYNGSMTSTSPTERNGKEIHHCSSSSNWMLWTEEIVSTGHNIGNLYNTCVRTLGTTDNIPIPYYSYSSDVVKFPYFNKKILRAPVANGELIPMHEWDTSDRLPILGFKIAKAEASGTATMQNLDNGISPCSTYSEGTGYDAAGKWRVPNLLEMAVISILYNNGTLAKTSNSIMTCTKFSWAYKDKSNNDAVQIAPVTGASAYWYALNSHHFLVYNGTYITLGQTNYNSAAYHLRCVRDIQKGE